MKRLSLLIAFLMLAGCAQVNQRTPYGTGHDDSNTVNALPVAGTSSFASSTILFLKNEDANRWLEQKFANFVSSGCVGATSPGLILTPTSCIAYNAGFRGTETGSITLPDNSSTWVAMDENTSGSNPGLTNFTRAGVTHYLIDSIDASQPTMPNDAQLIMRVTTSGGAITVVTDLRKTTPQVAGPAGPPGATGATGPTGPTGPAGPTVNGVVPQIIGYSAPNTVESETVTGDCAFTRGGANAYTISCTKVNGNSVSSTAPTNAQVWVENAGATSMVPVSISGDCTIAATGAITCTKINGVTPGGTCTNQFVTVISASGVPTCTTDTLASAQHANQGTTTTVLHGNAAGNPSFGAVALTTDVSGTLPVANGGTGLTTTFTAPGGRLTLTTATPVMSADASAQGTIFYDTYATNVVPVAGTNLIIGSDEISLILDSTNHTTGHLYDVFGYNASGTLTLCAGPSWTNSTTRSQAIALSGGVWTNSGSMTHCFNNSVDAGPIASHAGTYLGTFDATANGQTSMRFHPSAANGGSLVSTTCALCLYNAYNRVPLASTSLDNTSTWTYATATWRAADGNNNNRVSYVDGLGQSAVMCTYGILTTGNVPGETGCDLNSTSATPSNPAYSQSTTGGWNYSTTDLVRTLGLNFGQAVEFTTGATATFYGTGAGGGFQMNSLIVTVGM